jgi:CubicO group peptidase (beta-lactamase class C family)
MSSGLAFREEYADAANSDVIPMLFGEGKDDVASFAASYPQQHEPGSVWSYSSGTSNIISGVIARLFGNDGAAYERYMRERLFDPTGMTSAEPRFDAAGSWIGSSFCFAIARDFAKFGMLYLRDGVHRGQRILPEGWVEYSRTPSPSNPEYGAGWWLDLERPEVFYAIGIRGQTIAVDPEHDLTFVTLATDSAISLPVSEAILNAFAACRAC